MCFLGCCAYLLVLVGYLQEVYCLVVFELWLRFLGFGRFFLLLCLTMLVFVMFIILAYMQLPVAWFGYSIFACVPVWPVNISNWLKFKEVRYEDEKVGRRFLQLNILSAFYLLHFGRLVCWLLLF